MSVKQRLYKEYEDIKKNAPNNLSAGPLNDNLFEWEGVILGPTETPYEGGIFKVNIHIPINYPFNPPVFIFKTRIYHPNINSSGHICLDILKSNWSPSLTISKILLSICSLLSDPNSSDPLVPEIANEMKENYENYIKTARDWTNMYA
jgi:ubiquitin-conjugating enzyme E2 D/E